MIMESHFRDSTFRHIRAVLLFGLAIGLIFWGNYSTLATESGRMTNKDFMSLWTGGKAITLGLNPYDVEVWRPLRAAYGSTWMPDRIAPFPLWTFLFFAPLSFLSTQAAGALWMTLCELSLVSGIFLTTRILGWKGRAPLLLLLGAALFRPVFPAIANGQLSPVLFLFLPATYALHERGHPFAAGLLLALQAVKPNLTIIFLPTVGVIFLIRRDWRTLIGMVTGGLILLAASWIVLPGWLFQWLAAAEKGQVAYATPTLWGLAYELGGEQLWPGSAVGAGVLLYLGLLFLLWKQRRSDWLFGFGLAVIASTFLSPYLWAYEQLVLLFPTIIALHWGLTSKRGPRWAWWAGWWLTGVVLSWLLLFVAQQREVDTWSAFIPLASLGYFVLARQSS
ncbi:MAG: DUF2029 domain-containing protein [Anaerolineae bacterium]|nr:DUF2029 domain-containing protein [Anaerolineae bacterium]